MPDEEIVEQVQKVVIVRLVGELKLPAVLQIGDELAGHVRAERFERRVQFSLADLFVLG